MTDMLKDAFGVCALFVLIVAMFAVCLCIAWCAYCLGAMCYRWTKKPRRQKEQFTLHDRNKNIWQ